MTRCTHKNGSNIPLVDMNDDELNEAFDSFGLEADIVKSARLQPPEILLAVAVLHSPSAAARVLTYIPEYGDHDGVRFIKAFAKSCVRQDLLLPGEEVSCELWRFLEKPND